MPSCGGHPAAAQPPGSMGSCWLGAGAKPSLCGQRGGCHSPGVPRCDSVHKPPSWGGGGRVGGAGVRQPRGGPRHRREGGRMEPPGILPPISFPLPRVSVPACPCSWGPCTRGYGRRPPARRAPAGGPPRPVTGGCRAAPGGTHSRACPTRAPPGRSGLSNSKQFPPGDAQRHFQAKSHFSPSPPSAGRLRRGGEGRDNAIKTGEKYRGGRLCLRKFAPA